MRTQRPARRPHYPAALLVCLALAALATLTACSGTQPPDSLDYRSVWAARYPSTLSNNLEPTTLMARFRHAAAAESIADGEARWLAFLDHARPVDGEYEDAMQIRLVAWAELELQRLTHLRQGQPAEADRVTAQLVQMAEELK